MSCDRFWNDFVDYFPLAVDKLRPTVKTKDVFHFTRRITTDTLSIKMVDNEFNLFKDKVVLYNGMTTSVVAMFEDKTRKTPEKGSKLW